MRDCSTISLLTISWCQICDSIYTLCSDFWPRLGNKTFGPVLMLKPLVQGWCFVFATHASHPIPGRNCNRYYYPLSILFVCLFVCSFVYFDYSLWNMSGPRRNLPFNESRTHIRPFIRTRPHKPAGSSRVTSRPSTFALLLQDIAK